LAYRYEGEKNDRYMSMRKYVGIGEETKRINGRGLGLRVIADTYQRASHGNLAHDHQEKSLFA
jgi:hypothetical protein